jgi:hypothetical protein
MTGGTLGIVYWNSWNKDALLHHITLQLKYKLRLELYIDTNMMRNFEFCNKTIMIAFFHNLPACIV